MHYSIYCVYYQIYQYQQIHYSMYCVYFCVLSILPNYASTNKCRIVHLLVLIQYLPTYSIEQSPLWDANWFSASQKIPRILWSLKVHYSSYKCQPPVRVLSEIIAVHDPPSHFLKIHPKNYSCLCLGLQSCLFPSGVPTKTLYTPPFSSIHAKCPAHLILLNLITRTIFFRSTDH